MEINGTLSAIVTGGASGLGEATARMLSSMGAKVAIFDLDIDKGSTIAKELNSDFYEVDVSDVNSVNQAVLDFSKQHEGCLLYTSPSPRDQRGSRMPSSA